jgi:AcrR family transcriptional regulator
VSRRDSRANADRIVAAMCTLWTHDASPSLETVAAEAGVGIATLYRHFPNRTALEKAAISRAFAEEVLPALEGAEDRDILDVVDQFVSTLSRYAALFSAVDASEVADEAIADVRTAVIGLFAEGQARGFLRADLEPADTFWLLRMTVLGLTHEHSSPTIRRHYLAMMLAAVSPDHAQTLPSLATQDYDRMGIEPHLRQPFNQE